MSSASDKAKSFARNVSLPVFPSRTNLKLHDISIIPKMVKEVIANLDSSKASGPDCIPVVLADTYYLNSSMCLKESCFPDCWKVSSVVPACKNVGERSIAKSYRPVIFLSVVGKVFEKLVIIGLLIA